MKYNGVELMVEDGAVALLISHGWGAGWSTWNDPRLAYDKRVIEYFDSHPPKLSNKELDEALNFIEGLGYRDVYMGGYNKIVKEYVKVGESFRIDEYDGNETIFRSNDMMVFK